MPAQPDGMNAKVAVGMAGDEGRDRDLVVDVARGLECRSRWEETNGTVPLSLAGKGCAANIQNELGEEIRNSKHEIRRAERSGESFKRNRDGARGAEGGNQGGARGFRDSICTNSFFFWQLNRGLCRSFL
jgi:hypothetical protein